MRLLLLCAALAALSCGDGSDGPPPTSTLPSIATPGQQTPPATVDGLCGDPSRGIVVDSDVAIVNGNQRYRFVIRDADGEEREIIIPADTDPASCSNTIAETLELAFDGEILTVISNWVKQRGGEFVGFCHPSLGHDSGDPALRDYCSFLPLLDAGNVTVSVGPTQSDDVTTLVLNRRAGGAFLVEERTP